MTIEQEFFEAFNVPKKEIYIGKKKEQLCNHCDDNCFGCDNKEYKYIYLPITPEIVLGLAKILMNFGWLHCEKFTIDKYLTEFDNDELKDKIQIVESSFEICILKTCIKLKDEIQDQVKELFKC